MPANAPVRLASSGGIGKRPKLDVLELYIAGMALETDMAGAPARAVAGNGVIGDELAVERDFYRRGASLDFERVPLAGRVGSDRRRRRKGIDRAGLVQRAVVLPGRRVETHIVDLDLVAAVGRDLRVAARVARVQCREADQDAGIVGAAARHVGRRIEREPID